MFLSEVCCCCCCSPCFDFCFKYGEFSEASFFGNCFPRKLEGLASSRGESRVDRGAKMCRSVKESHDRRCLLRLLGMGIIYSDMRYLMLDSWR